MDEIQKVISDVVKDLFKVNVEPVLTRPDEQFGDLTTNIALQLAAQSKNEQNQSPKSIAEDLKSALEKLNNPDIDRVEVAGPGFLNIKLSDKKLLQLLQHNFSISLKGKSVVAEYSDPNPFKVLHAGHLYTSVVGDAIANLLEASGAKVHRVNFGGDVGLHVGKTMYAILQRLGGENPGKLNEISKEERSEWLASAYIEGTNAFEENETAKTEIMALNKRVYQLHNEKDHDSAFAQIYWTTRSWSYDYFNEFYKRIGSHFDKYYPESETAELGLETVNRHIGKVFEKSDGAIIFRGEDYDLHTRVFINSEGLPTYETKDVGLIMAKKRDYNFDKSVVITGNEQEQYMIVVLKAIEQFEPELAKATTHLTHGIVKLKGGVKMSSRKGNILRAVDVLDAAKLANKQLTSKDDEQTALSAVKYAFLKNRMGGDIIYDPNESVALEGNSGPYIQYAHARACSILGKAKQTNGEPITNLESDERSLVRKIGEFTEVVDKATKELMPHHISTYLYELAQKFNNFYEHNRVIDNPREAIRLKLVESYANTLKKGLELLNIPAPDKM